MRGTGLEHDEQRMSIVVDSDVETRKGVHSNLVSLTVNGSLSRLDFLYGDIDDGSGGMRAVLSSRVIMQTEDLVALKALIESHLREADSADGSK